jgi:putative Ca2+/H+ antiporter (TMEM165/GDT1 family)
MELGDKTQFAVIALSAEYKSALLVYLGVMLAFALATTLGVIVGKALMRFVPMRYILLGIGLVFVLFGIIFLVNALLEQSSSLRT